MNAEWMLDARKIPGEVMNYLRRIAVRAIDEKHYSPELVADLFGIDRTSIYDWLRNYRHQGEEALDTRKAPGAPWVITPDIDAWMKETILESVWQKSIYQSQAVFTFRTSHGLSKRPNRHRMGSDSSPFSTQRPAWSLVSASA